VLTVEDALASDNFLHRGLAVLDRRLGTRRLKEIEPLRPSTLWSNGC
jgi:hypothetical protein